MIQLAYLQSYMIIKNNRIVSPDLDIQKYDHAQRQVNRPKLLIVKKQYQINYSPKYSHIKSQSSSKVIQSNRNSRENKNLRMKTQENIQDQRQNSRINKAKATRQLKSYINTLNDEPLQGYNNFTINLCTNETKPQSKKSILQFYLNPIRVRTKIITQKLQYESQKRKQFQENKSGKLKNQRYISNFEKNIKEKISKISLDQNQSAKSFQIELKRQNMLPQSLLNKNFKPNNKFQQRLLSIRPKAKQSSNRQADQSYKKQRLRYYTIDKKAQDIRKIIKKKKNTEEKSQILGNFYKKYEYLHKNGDSSALDLMCLANLARADVLLHQN